MSKLNITQYLLKPSQHVPNNPRLPVLYYQQVFKDGGSFTAQFKDTFERNNWRGTWVNGIFDYHHYHSTSHEVLGVAAGSAEVILGGPDGDVFNLVAGDMVVLPAGTGHCLLISSLDFKIVGAYPKGQENYDICTMKDNTNEKVRKIAEVPLPTHDPVAGENGPLMEVWTAKA